MMDKDGYVKHCSLGQTEGGGRRGREEERGGVWRWRSRKKREGGKRREGER